VQAEAEDWVLEICCRYFRVFSSLFCPAIVSNYLRVQSIQRDTFPASEQHIFVYVYLYINACFCVYFALCYCFGVAFRAHRAC